MSIYLNKIRRRVGYNYERNISLRLILSMGGFYIGLQALYIVIMVLADDQKSVLYGYYIPNIGLQSFEVLAKKPWIILSHFLFSYGFFELVTNMLWLYLFSSVIQNLVGYKEVLPIFLSGVFIAALGVMGVNEIMPLGAYILVGSYGGVMAMGVASMLLSPKYNLYLAERFAIPLWVLFAVFFTLNMVMFVPNNVPMLVLVGFGGITGLVYMLLLKNGFAIGNTIYGWIFRIENSVGKNTDINKENASASKLMKNNRNEEIDSILEKIHQKGILSLSTKEKETLENYSNNL